MTKKDTKSIADAHIDTRVKKGRFDNPSDDVISDIKDGKVIEPVLKYIEDKECSVYCVTVAKDLGHASDRYVFGVRNGFYKLLKR